MTNHVFHKSVPVKAKRTTRVKQVAETADTDLSADIEAARENSGIIADNLYV
jgi:hypothetical protein